MPSLSLTAYDPTESLVRRGLLDAASIDSGEVFTRAEWRRNENYQVTLPGCAGYFVKRGGTGTSALAGEAVIYQWLSSRWAACPRFLARCYGYDETAGALILELIPEAENLQAYHERLGRFPPGVASG